MLVSANGRYPQSSVDAFEQLCKQKGLILIEDSAQSMGSFYPDGRHIGTAGLVGSFSFSAPKIISTGQGGAIVTNDDKVAKKLRRLKDFGRLSGGNDIHDEIGYNFKFTELQACIGIEQMKKLPFRVERKKEILKIYQRLLKSIRQVHFFEQDLDNTTPWFIDCIVKDRERLQLHLKENNIGTRVMYSPITHQKAYGISGEYPIAELVGSGGLWLPSATQLSDNDIIFICNSIIDFYES
jgi:perosamine synthetase